jgi:DnaJ homolog subfamily C member 11
MSIARKLYPNSPTQGIMELRMGPTTPVFVFNVVVPKPFDWTEESYEPPEDTDALPKPASVSGLARGAYHYSYGASVAGIASALQAEVGLTFAELKLRFTAGMQLTLAGLQWLMSWTWQPSDSSVIGANVGVSVEGVMLRLELGILRQKLIVPIALSPHNDHSLALYVTVTPTVLLMLGYHFVMRPRRRVQRIA